MLTKLPEILSAFEELEDPRKPGGNTQHCLHDMIFIVLCGTLCGCNTWAEIEDFAWEVEDWLLQHIELAGGIPSHDTLGRVFAKLDTHQFAVCVQKWIKSLKLNLKGKGIHIDGKTARRSYDTASGKKALQIVNAWADELSVCLGQVAVDENSNEITAVPVLLDLLKIRGATVTLDAMHCQKETLAKIRDKGGDYIVTVKGNQESLLQTLEEEFIKFGEGEYKSRKVRSEKKTFKTRGRVTNRTISVAAAPKALKETGEWADIKTIGTIYRHREASEDSRGKPIKETHFVTYFISSHEPKVKNFIPHIDKHWTVENSLHWTLDVTFSEDDSRIRTENGQAIIASFRRIALTILKRDTKLGKSSINRKRKRAGWRTENLEALLSGI